MQGDPIRALVELVSNSDDSYTRLNQEGPEIIEVVYKKRGSSCDFEVRDSAEGMSPDKVEECFTEYGRLTGGMDTGHGVRAYFGEGAKDALATMVKGRIVTIRDGTLTECRLFFKNDEPHYEIDEAVRAPGALRREHGIPGNGTVAYFTLEVAPVPRFGTVQEELTNHYLLRKTMTNQKRRVLLVDKSGGKPDKRHLRYVMPKGVSIPTQEFAVAADRYDEFAVHVTINRATEELTQSGDTRLGGLLVIDDKNAVYDCTLFKYDNEPLAAHLFGEIQIMGSRKLLLANEPVLKEERRLNRRHAFCQRVIQEVEGRIAYAVEEEKKRQKETLSRLDLDEAAKYRKAFSILNQIAQEEIQGAISLVGPGEDVSQVPEDGMSLHPPSATITVDKRYNFQLRCDTKRISRGSEITLSSTHPRINLVTPAVKLDQEGDSRVVRKYITVEGKEPDVDGKIRAEFGSFVCESKVHVEPEKELLLAEGMTLHPETMTLRPNQPRRLLLLVYVKMIEDGSKVSIVSDNPAVNVSPSEVSVSEADAVRHVAKYELTVWGEGAGQDAMITAEYGQYMAVCEVRVRVKEDKPEGDRKGLFSEPEFNQEPAPGQRCWYSPETGKIIIYVQFPSVRLYLGDKCQYRKTLAAQVLVADLVAETCFREIARQGVEKSSALIRPEAKEERVRRDSYELSRKHGARVHKALVDQKLVAESRLLDQPAAVGEKSRRRSR